MQTYGAGVEVVVTPERSRVDVEVYPAAAFEERARILAAVAALLGVDVTVRARTNRGDGGGA